MDIKLYPHNERAYRAAVSMLGETGRAAVIHPTGTGKSFIAFKLCEDNPQKRFCWLSPSEHIYRTQTENLIAAGGAPAGNIFFITYARLMAMDAAELSGLRPDYIILDEFHRCGAKMWGQGVQRLLRANPNAPVLGLSATNIRYLDNRRDMAEELFGGNVASEMTLGEAIACGILPAPKYVISVYSYHKQLEKYERCIRHVRSEAARDAAQKYLEALRRALDMADGLDVVFDRHMARRTGKYLVFCTSVEHMRELRGHCGEWFGKVDPRPRIYSVCADDRDAKKKIAAFKADNTQHLKLLFCVDMLNEGIHIEGISGVILFRPTVSPTVYKQQVGRALSAAGTAGTVVFDVVNNFENLCSVGTIEAELEEAVACYRFLGQESALVRQRFEIIDEVRESRALFDALNDALSAPWETMFAQAEKFFRAHGHLEVPKRYRTEEGYSLGAWVSVQRRVRAGQQYGRLTPERIERLDRIGMVWGRRYDLVWSRYFQAAQTYYFRHHGLDVPVDYVTEEGLPLGRWISGLRQQRADRRRGSGLTPERIAQLDGMGMIWDKFSFQWERNYLACAAYYKEHGNLDVPADYIGEGGLRIGAWLGRLRQARDGRLPKAAPLTEAQIARLDAIGMNWEGARARGWECGYRHAAAYAREHGNLDVPAAYVCKDGFPLGRWLRRHVEVDRKTGKTGIRLTAERKERLAALGMRWEDPEDPWEMRYQLAREYFLAHGDLNVPGDYVENGVWLGKWLNEQRQIYLGRRSGKRLTAEQIQKLEALSIQWTSRWEQAWEMRYAEARQYFEEHGDLTVPKGYVGASGKRLDVWVAKQRARQREGALTDAQSRKMLELG